MRSKMLSLGDVSENFCYNLNKISKLSIFLRPVQSEDKKSVKKKPGPGFEPGLLRPQRSVLTTRRSRLTIPPTAGWRQKICLLL